VIIPAMIAMPPYVISQVISPPVIARSFSFSQTPLRIRSAPTRDRDVRQIGKLLHRSLPLAQF
jgi:hypothetical protein